MRNGSGYNDPTSARALACDNQRKKKEFIRISKPVPADNKVYFISDKTPSSRIYDVFMHYRGYHNPEMGEWVSVYAETPEEAKLKSKSIPVKKPAETVFARRRSRDEHV